VDTALKAWQLGGAVGAFGLIAAGWDGWDDDASLRTGGLALLMLCCTSAVLDSNRYLGDRVGVVVDDLVDELDEQCRRRRRGG
jgi:hypothetical protein